MVYKLVKYRFSDNLIAALIQLIIFNWLIQIRWLIFFRRLSNHSYFLTLYSFKLKSDVVKIKRAL